MKLSQSIVSDLLNSKLTVFDSLKLSGLNGLWVREVGSDDDFYIDISFFNALGYINDDEFDKIDWRDLLYPTTKETFLNFLHLPEEEIKKYHNSTFGFLDVNRNLRWFFFNTQFLHELNHSFQVFLIKDITEMYSQKLNTELHKERLIALNQLISTPTDIIQFLDENFTFIDFLANDSKYLFKNPSEFIGKRIDEIGFPKQVESLILHALRTSLHTDEQQIVNYSLTINNSIEYFTLEVRKLNLSSLKKTEFICLIKNISQEIHSELENKKQSEKLHALFSLIDDLKFVIDRNGTYIDVIATKDELLIEPSLTLIGKNLRDFFNPDLLEKFLSTFERSFELKKAQTITYSVDIDSQEYSFEARVFPLEANNHILALVRDITEETRVQEKIKQDQEILHKLSQHLPGCFYIFEKKNNGKYAFNYLSDGFLNIIPDYSINDILNDFDLILPYFHKDDLNPFIQAVEFSLKNLSPFNFEFRIHVPKKSSIKWIKAKSMPERKTNGVYIWHGYMEDITNDKLQEQKIVHSENLYKSLFSQSPQPMWIFDVDTYQILEVNDTAVSFYGYSREEFLSMTILDIRPEEEIPSTISLVKGTESEIQTFNYLKHRKKNGQIIYVTLTYHSLLFNGKQARHIVITDMTDITVKENEIQAISQEFERVFNGTQESLQLIEYFPDKDFRFIRSNKKHQEITGLSLESIRGKTPFDLFEKEIADEKITKYKEALELGQPIEFEEYVTLNDELHIWKTTLSPYITKSSGVYIVCSSIDITQQVEAEKHLAESIKKLEFTIEAAQFGAWEWDIETGRSLYSENVLSMLGYHLSEVENTDTFYFSLLHPNDISEIKQIISEVIVKPGLDSYQIEFRMKSKDGLWKWIESHGIVTSRNALGKAITITGVSQDITVRKQQELDLLRISTFLTQTSEVSKVGGWEYDFLNNTIQWSDIVKDFHDVSDDFIDEVNQQKKNISDLVGFYKEGESRDKIQIHLKNLVEQQLPFDDEYEFISAKGVEKWLRVIGKPVIIDGVVAKMFGSMTDITEQKNNFLQINKLLELTHFQNQKLKEYTYLTSHNLRLPIVNLISLCSLMKDDDEKEKYIDMIERSAHKLNDTMKIMHDILVIEQGKEAEVNESINVELAVLRNYELIVHLFRSEIEFTTDIDSSLFVTVIPAYFDSILNNLITNAIKYRKPNSKAFIHIAAESDSDFVLIKVTDQGLGLDMNLVKDKLFKLNNRFHKHIEGKGIGLFYSKSQIDAMGGRIEINSEVEVGTTFSIWLPLSDQVN